MCIRNLLIETFIVIFLLVQTDISAQTNIDIEFLDFAVSDTVTIGGTMELTGTLHNKGTNTIPANWGMEMVADEIGNSFPSTPYGISDVTDNFSNPPIEPGDSYVFTKQIEVDPQYFVAEQNAVIIIWPVESLIYQDTDTINNIYIDTIRVRSFAYKLEEYNRRAEPVVMKGEECSATFIGQNIEDIVGFRFENDNWIQIPVQIDEMVELDMSTPYGTSYTEGLVGQTYLFYTDENTFIGADSDPGFDENDELVFMVSDAGMYAETNSNPPGVIDGSGVEVEVLDPLNSSRRYVYLYLQDGSLLQDAGVQYVDYQFEPLYDNYPITDGTENTWINTDYYSWNFSDTWVSDGMQIKHGTVPGDDLLEKQLLLLGPDLCEQNEMVFSDSFNLSVFLTNKNGAVRAIRSYMGAGDYAFTQRTHLFYQRKQDIITDIRTDQPLLYYDLFNYNSNIQGLSYTNNGFVDGIPIDGINENNATDFLLEWEMVTGDQGTLFLMHNVDQGASESFTVQVDNYWNDGAQGSDYNCLDNGSGYGSSGIIVNVPNICTEPLNQACSEDDFLKLERSIYFEKPNLSVLDAFVHDRYNDVPLQMTCSPYSLPCYRLELTAWLEGAYDEGSGEMLTSLNLMKLLPGQTIDDELAIATPPGQPYNASPWNYTGMEGIGFMDSDYTTDDVDWILVYVKTASGYTLKRMAGIIQKNGVVRFDNSCPLEIIPGIDNFHLMLEHRNHMGITTIDPIAASDGAISFDFRAAPGIVSSVLYGYKEILPGVWAMHAGDADKITDEGGHDVNAADKVLWDSENGIFLQYLNTDLNMDGEVNGADKILWGLNNGVSVPIQN